MSCNVVIISPKSSSDNEQNKEYELAGRIKEQLESSRLDEGQSIQVKSILKEPEENYIDENKFDIPIFLFDGSLDDFFDESLINKEKNFLQRFNIRPILVIYNCSSNDIQDAVDAFCSSLDDSITATSFMPGYRTLLYDTKKGSASTYSWISKKSDKNIGIKPLIDTICDYAQYIGRGASRKGNDGNVLDL